MAKKKYKSIKLEQDELKPISIGAFESRKKTSIGTFIIITIFVLAVIFLPQISEKIDEYLNPPTAIPNNPTLPNDEPTTPEDPGANIDETFYAYTPNLIIDRDEISVSEINVDSSNLTLNYTVTNKSNTYQNIEDLNYFIEIYNSDKTLLERVKLATNQVLASNSFQTYTKNITSDSATTIGYLVLVKKTTADYSEITLNEDETGTSSLVCSNAHELVTYKFTDNQLIEVSSVIEYSLTDPNYETIYTDYQTLSSTYNRTEGITSTFFSNTNGFNITTIVNLEEANRTYLFNADTFKKGTEPKVVSFEMESSGFNCN